MTGLIYDPDRCAGHNKEGHAEHAGRLAHLELGGLRANVSLRAASDAELMEVHTLEHLQSVKARCASGPGMLDADTYCGPESEAISREVAGGLIDLCVQVLAGKFANGLAIVRPPGHHATAQRAMGFCLYNGVAVAAASLRQQGLRVAIVDIDVHHGNGTQDIFYADQNVLYLSSHQHPHYPGTGLASETGVGPGVGFTLNCPLVAGTGDAGFLAAYEDKLLPALAAFEPDFVLISAGYDAHESDPLAGLMVTTEGFRHLLQMLKDSAAQLCEGKIAFALEGGYHPEALAQCLSATLDVLQS